MNFYRTVILFTALAVSTVASAQWDPQDIASRIPDQGEYHLALFNDENRDGFMRLGWYHEGETLTVYDRTMMPSAEVYETYHATMDAKNLNPRTVAIRFHQGTAILGIKANLNENEITGQRTVERIGQETDISELASDKPPGTILRAVSFLLPLMLDTDSGQEITYDWYSPLTGQVEKVTLTSHDGGEVETPSGVFQTTRWELRGGNPENDIYVSHAETPQIIRIDVIGQPLQFLAVESSNSG